MNIDIKELTKQAEQIYNDCAAGNREFWLAAVSFVLAEVAKHNTPDKPAYYVTSEQAPTKTDNIVLLWNPRGGYWLTAEGYTASSSDYPFWMSMPAAPVDSDTLAFDKACAKFMHESQRDNARKMWDAALAHRDKSKP